VGAVVVKTKEHVEDLWHLPDDAADELGPFLRSVSGAVVDGLGAERLYLTMWVDAAPHHVHLVVYPRWPDDPDRALDLQVRRKGEGPPPSEAAEAAEAADRLREFLRPQALTRLC
jgi:diadenosine tetraphosphate (Ap4A) HIT family hydrolase